jgi:hypothetical protein
LHDEFGDEVQVRGRVDFVRDARVDDAQDRALLAAVGSNLSRLGGRRAVFLGERATE